MHSESAVAEFLLELVDNKRFNRTDFFPAYHQQASQLVGTNPYAFALALSLHRQTRKTETIWTIPFDLREKLGHLDPVRIARMSLSELESVFSQLPHKPRFVNDAPRTVKELSTLVVQQFGGDAARIWKNRTAADVKKTFRSIYGVGEQIANLSVLLLEQRYGIHFNDLDHRGMDIKADTHTCRVLYRLGVARDESPDEAISAARRLNPSYPGALDAPLWIIGRRLCHPSRPECEKCPLGKVCNYTKSAR